MNEKSNSALVPRPPSALEKAMPGARRILSGMVADALALAKKEQAPVKRKFRVLTCSGEEAIVATWTAIIRERLGQGYEVNVTDRPTGAEILEFVQQQPIDLIIAMVNNVLVPATDGDDRILKAVELLVRLKAEYGIPIIAFSTFEPTSFDLPELLKRGGIDAFLSAPFEIGDALKVLDGCLKTPLWDRSDARTLPVIADTELESWYQTGEKYSCGEGVPQDLEEAAKWYRRAAERDHASAQHDLAYCYTNGEGVPQDFEEAFKWYRKAAEQGGVRMQTTLGYYYAIGEGVPQDFEEAFKWYRKAAEQGDAVGQTNLGHCYYNGEGVPQDFEQAFKWYRKAAEQGDAVGQTNLGYCYAIGEGVPQDFEQAFKWYRKAAEQGDAGAQYGLANSYYYGRGVPQTYVEAVKWCRKAAKQGHANAQFMLGGCLATDQGGEDFEEGVDWLRKAAEQGNEGAKQALQFLQR
jgi:TPR repeat protein